MRLTGSVAMALGGALGLLLVAALWTIGLFTAASPRLLRLLFFAAGTLGAILVVGAAIGWRLQLAARVFGLASGLLAMAAIAAFAWALFSVESAAVDATSRVAAGVPPQRLRILQLNVFHDYPGLAAQDERRRALTAALQKLAPDLITLQEAWSTVRHGNLAELLGAELEMDVVYAKANGSLRLIGFEEGSAILSRFPIESARRRVLRPRRPPWVARIALVAGIDLGGESLQIVSTHLDHRDSAAREAEAAQLASELSLETYTVVAGDLNARSSPVLGVFERIGLRDVLPGGIDHVLIPVESAVWHEVGTSRVLRGTDLELPAIDDVTISDHPALLVELVRAGEPADAG